MNYSKPKLTIMSVCYHSNELLELNHSVISSRFTDFNFLVVDNSYDSKLDRNKFIVIPGQIIKPIVKASKWVNGNSHHHALALDIGMKCLCKHRHLFADVLLILDHDFFVLQDLGSMVDYLIDKNLDFIGAPYIDSIPRPYHDKNKPTHSFFINLNKVDISKWSWVPIINNSELAYDTGHQIREKITKENFKYELIDGRTFSDPYFLQHQSPELYFWQNEIYGIHFHAKIHLRKVSINIIKSIIQKYSNETIKF